MACPGGWSQESGWAHHRICKAEEASGIIGHYHIWQTCKKCGDRLMTPCSRCEELKALEFSSRKMKIAVLANQLAEYRSSPELED